MNKKSRSENAPLESAIAKHTKKKESPHISSGQAFSQPGVNSTCHGWTGVLPPHDREVMPYPKVFAVYWGGYFYNNPDAVPLFNRFFTEILTSRFMDGLSQYRVGTGRFLGSVTVLDPSTRFLSQDELASHLVGWLDNGTIPIKPSGDETNLLYVIFTQEGTVLTFDDLRSGTDFSGYHRWGTYDKIGESNLFWAAIPWNPHSPTMAVNLVNLITPTITHEMVEAFTDRDFDGFKNDAGCEIGDICEHFSDAKVDGWVAERYWSNSHQACFPIDDFVQPNLFFKIVSRSSGKVLDIPFSSTNDGEQVQQFLDNGQFNQQWRLAAMAGSYYKIISRKSGKVLDVRGESHDNHAAIQQFRDNGGWNQHWQLIPVEGFFKIVSRSSQKLLDVPNASAANGIKIQQSQDNNQRNQHWQFILSEAPGFFKILSRVSRKALDIPNSGMNDGLQIQQFHETQLNNQHWQLVPVAGGFFKIVSRLSMKVLDVRGLSQSDGAVIQQFKDLGGLNQHWQLVPVPGGFFKIVSRNTGSVLDLPGGSLNDFVVIQQCRDNGGLNQHWELIPA